MADAYLFDQDNWVLPSNPMTLTSTIPNYEESLPVRVNREGVTNYIKNRGTLNLGDWATEGRRMSTSTTPGRNVLEAPPPKVLGPDALQNYIKSRSSTPNLIYSNLEPPNPHHHLRVKKEGRDNYNKNHRSQMKALLESYGKLPLPEQTHPHTQGETATNLFYTHQKGRMGSLLTNYGHFAPSPRRIPHVKGDSAEENLQKSYGHSHILEHTTSFREPVPDPHVKGTEAHLNYNMAQGRHVETLFHDYGKLPLSARTAPKVKYDGVQNFQNAQGDAVRKAISQCPPSNRYIERPQSVPLWP